MAKISRSAFFSMLVASGAVILVAGCGSSTPKNSNYSGSYKSAYTIPQLNDAGAFDFTIDVKGRIQGTLDNGNGTVREVSGTLKNNGTFDADTLNRTTNVTGRISGTMAGTAGSGSGTATSVAGGNFTLVENSVTAAGSFEVGGTVTTPGTSGYQGFYNGNYNIPELSQNGTTSFSVDASGNMTGSLVRGSETGLLSGSIASSGSFTATVKYNSDSQVFTGTLIKTTDGSTVGNFTVTQNGKTYAGNFSKTTVSTGDSPYAGSYRGTYGMPEQGENGNLSFTVGPSGSFTGFFSQSNNSAVGTFTGAFNNDGSFAGTVTYDPSTSIAARPITGQIGTGSVSGTLSGDFVMNINGTLTPGNFEVQGGSEVVSNYRASYTDAGYFSPAVSFGGAPQAILSDTNIAEFSVDKEGSILGSFGTYAVTGRITNDARITGTVTGADGKGYAFRGIVNKLIWTVITGKDADGNPTTKDIPGIKGDMIFTVNAKEYTGFLKATGGDGTTQ